MPAYSPLGYANDGAVGRPKWTAGLPGQVPDPSPGVNSVLWDGTMGPTPAPAQRIEDARKGPPPRQ